MIVDRQVDVVTGNGETLAGLAMLEQLPGNHRVTVGADKGYDNQAASVLQSRAALCNALNSDPRAERILDVDPADERLPGPGIEVSRFAQSTAS